MKFSSPYFRRPLPWYWIFVVVLSIFPRMASAWDETEDTAKDYIHCYHCVTDRFWKGVLKLDYAITKKCETCGTKGTKLNCYGSCFKIAKDDSVARGCATDLSANISYPLAHLANGTGCADDVTHGRMCICSENLCNHGFGDGFDVGYWSLLLILMVS